jgi:uncharacterized protein
MANHFVSNPIEVVSVGQKVKVRVLEIDVEREKVSLSMKDPSQQNSRDGSLNRPNNNLSRPHNDDSPRPDREETSGIRSNITFS